MFILRPFCVLAALFFQASVLAQAPVPQPAGTLDIGGITAQALSVSPTARAAQQRLIEVQARLAETSAQRRLQPVFTGSAGGSYGKVAQPMSDQTFYTLQAGLAVPFPNIKRLSAARVQADAVVRSAQIAMDRARLDLRFRANDTYYGVLRARGALDIASQNLADAQRQVTDTQKRVDAGDVPAADVLKAQVPLAQARVALTRSQSAARIAEQALNSLIQRSLSAPVSLAVMPKLPPLTLTREEAVARALTRSPDVREAQANVAAASAGIVVARHANDPEYSLQASYVKTGDITAYSDLTTLTVNVTIPLGSGGIQRQQRRQVQSQLDQAKIALQLARQQSELATEQSFLDVETGQANITATQETVRIAEDSLAKARLAFAAGLTTTREVLDAQLALSQARTDQNSALYDLAIARAKLEQATGAGMSP